MHCKHRKTSEVLGFTSTLDPRFLLWPFQIHTQITHDKLLLTMKKPLSNLLSRSGDSQNLICTEPFTSSWHIYMMRLSITIELNHCTIFNLSRREILDADHYLGGINTWGCRWAGTINLESSPSMTWTHDSSSVHPMAVNRQCDYRMPNCAISPSSKKLNGLMVLIS